MTGWCTSNEAIELLSPDGSDWQWAATTLATHGAIDQLEAIADRLIVVHVISGPIENLQDVPPPHELWEDVGQWTRRDWEIGTFTAQFGLGQRIVATGVRFDRAGVELLAPTGQSKSIATSQAAPVEAGRGGNPGKISAWHEFWFAAMKLQADGALLDRARFPTQASLRREILSQIGDTLSDDSIKAQVQRIWFAFCE